jgi:hypothetical protein
MVQPRLRGLKLYDQKLVVKDNKKITDEVLLDFLKGLEEVYEYYLRQKEVKLIRNLLLLNEVYNSIAEVKRILRIRKFGIIE